MSSAKTRLSSSNLKRTTALPNSGATGSTTSRLSKAKSSPNVSKSLTSKHSPSSYPRIQEERKKPEERKQRNGGAATASAPTKSPRGTNHQPKTTNVTIVKVESNNGTPKSRRTANEAREDRKVVKTRSSCTILEDRALLKKGLGSPTPKPLTLIPQKLEKCETQKQDKNDQEIVKRKLSRAVSLWSVSHCDSAARICRSGRPSKIPLLTQRFGQSLADLSVVDRLSEQTNASIIDFDQVDRSIDERIYANCSSSSSSSSSNSDKSVDPIYENLKGLRKDEEIKTQTAAAADPKEAPLSTPKAGLTDLEKRAEELIAELNDEDDEEEENDATKNKTTIQTILSEEESRKKKKKKPKKRRDEIYGFTRSQENLLQTSYAKDNNMNIQEIRRTWEQQIRKSQKVDETDTRCNANQKVPEKSTDKSEVASGKRTKEIEELVNFFNCKNREAQKELWTKANKDETIAEKTKKGANSKSGYTSDGNSSEDSGHISNENEVEEQTLRFQEEKLSKEDKSLNKDERFLKEIIEDIDGSLERTIDVFETTPIVRRFVIDTKKTNSTSAINPKQNSNLSTSSEVSSIDSWEEKGRNSSRNETRPLVSTKKKVFGPERLNDLIINLQAKCRGYLARRKLNQQKEELKTLKSKLESLTEERDNLKHNNVKLQAKISEMSADFAEEHSASTLASERIGVETSERKRLQRELEDVTEANKNLRETTERLEMELLYARAAELGNGEISDTEEPEDGAIYKQRYEQAIRELEFTKRKMAQQHEDDLEQLVGLKKQLEKKLADAYEEVEEQRQVVGQWKRRVQKLNGEMHDLRLLLEKQTARNNLLEKKQRKFDSELQNVMNDLRQEKAQRERLTREKEILINEKFALEQSLSDTRLEWELKEERFRALSQELEDLTCGGKTEEEVTLLKKTKHELEKKVKDQEEELDDMSGQIQLLEQAKARLEAGIEQQRKEIRKELQQRDEELEEVRGNALKKVKAMECQLENEHEERTILLREKHELERRLVAIEEQERNDRAIEAETIQRLKRDLRRTKALLKDAQAMLERSKCETVGKAALRQLKNQLEDTECARAAAVKAKQALEQDLNELQAVLEETKSLKSEAEERANIATREKSELLAHFEENEEELTEMLRKYRSAVQQVSAEQSQLQEAHVQLAALESEKASLMEQLAEVRQRLESVEHLGDPTANSLATRRLEFRTKELESKLELEQTTRSRLETQITRLKESMDKLQTETAQLRTKEQTAQDATKRLQRSLREAREEANSSTVREFEATRIRRDLEKALEAAESEMKMTKDDLRVALQRIDDLQSAIQNEIDLECNEEVHSDNSDSD